MIKNLSVDNFETEVIDSSIPIIIDFYADWCGPCQLMKPIFEKVSKSFEGKLKFMKLDTQSESGLSMKFGVQGIPTFVIINEGKEVGRFVGYMAEEDFKFRIKSVIDRI